MIFPTSDRCLRAGNIPHCPAPQLTGQTREKESECRHIPISVGICGQGGCSERSLHTQAGEAGWKMWSSTEITLTEKDEMQPSAMLPYPLLCAVPGRSSSTQTGQILSLMRRTKGHFCNSILLSLISHRRAEKLGHNREKDFPRLPGRHLPTSHCHQVHLGCFGADSM